MGCLGGSLAGGLGVGQLFKKKKREPDPGISVTTIASDLDASAESKKKRRKRKKGDLMAGEAQLDLGASGQLGSGSPRASLFG